MVTGLQSVYRRFDFKKQRMGIYVILRAEKGQLKLNCKECNNTWQVWLSTQECRIKRWVVEQAVEEPWQRHL